MTGPPHGARTVLALVVALQLVAETALTPYWPGMFRELFGVEDLSATGSFLTVCRVAGLAALPLWGVAARRWSLPRLLVVGLLLCSVCDLGLALAPTLGVFTLLSAGVVAAGSSLVLAYPALVTVVEERSRADRVSAVVAYVGVFHGSAVLATVVGAGVVAMPEPRVGLALFAVLDVSLAVLVWRSVPADRGPEPAPPAGSEPVRRQLSLRALVMVALLAVLVDLGFAVTRPFFVELLLHRDQALAGASLLFLIPSCAALVVLPAVRPLLRRLGRRLLPASALLAAGGLVLQAVGTTLTLMVAGRVVLGAGLGLAMVALDLRIFGAVGTGGPAFSVVETARSAALLAAPMMATAAATRTLSLPLLVGAVVFACAAALAAPRRAGTADLADDQTTEPARPEHQEAVREPETIR